jgi:hypothetical protein
MSIRTLNSPSKFSPVKIDPFNFRSRIFEINEDSPEQQLVSEKPVETPKQHTIATEK